MAQPVTYCSVQDVADFLRVDITDTSTPNKSQVSKLILRKEIEIERRTGHAFREAQAKIEVHDMPIIYEFGWGTPIFLRHRNLRLNENASFDTSKGDKIEIFQGATSTGRGGAARYEDITDSVAGTYEIEPVYGRIYMRGFIFTVMRKNRVRVTYRYGDDNVPQDIEEACIKLVATELLTTSFRADSLPLGGSGGWSWSDSINTWKEDIDRIIWQRQEVMTVI